MVKHKILGHEIRHHEFHSDLEHELSTEYNISFEFKLYDIPRKLDLQITKYLEENGFMTRKRTHYDNAGMEYTYVCFVSGITSLHEGDKYDEKKGNWVAEGKAKRKMFHILKVISTMLYDYYVKKFVESHFSHNRYLKLMDTEDKHLKEII